MFLSKVAIDTKYSSAAGALQNPSYMHSLIQKEPFNSSRKEKNVLYRVLRENGRTVLYVQSDTAPNWRDLHGRGFKVENVMCIDAVQNVLCNGSSFGFRTLVNPVTRTHDPKTDAVIKRFIENPEKRMEWLRRYAEKNGFELLQAKEMPYTKVDNIRKKDNKAFTIKGVEFKGELVITDQDAFRKCFREGIGPEKAYGYGMLMLSRKQA